MSSHPEPAAKSSVILAAGGVLTRGEHEVIVVHRKRHNDWSLPKGKLDPGESFEEAALREVREETGCIATLGDYIGTVGYRAKGRPKAVLFWRMSLLEQRPLDHDDEVDRVLWLTPEDALRRLTYEQEREIIGRVFPRASVPVKRKQQARLTHALATFDIELAFLEQRAAAGPSLWAGTARAHLAEAHRFASSGDTDGAWQALHAAQRATLYGLTAEELEMRAAVVRAEAEKLAGWRLKAVAALLAGADVRLTPERVAQAALIRDEDAANRYSRIRLTAEQVKLLFGLVSAGTAVLGSVMILAPRDVPAAGWEYPLIAAVLLFGLLGACFSAAQSLIGSTTEVRIPERIANRHVTTARVIFGAVAGLAGYAFIQSRVLNIQFGDNNVAAALTVAFLFGYTGDRAIARVAGILG